MRAMDDRNRTTPVTLTRNAPIAQPPLQLFLAQLLRGQIRGDRVDRSLVFEPVVFAGVNTYPVLAELGAPLLPRRLVAFLSGRRRAFGSRDHEADRQAVLAGEAEIPLIVTRHAHDGALAVRHQHVIADPHWNLLAGQGMRDAQARRHALLLHGGEFRFHGGALLALLDERGELWIGTRRAAG